MKVWDTALSPGGRWLVTATLNGGAPLRRVGTWEAGGTYPLFGPGDETVVTETGLGALKVCDVATGRELVRLTCPLETRLRPLCFSPDGGRLVAWGRESRRVHVWELAAIRTELRAHGLDW